MLVNQLAVFLENKPGKLDELIRIIADANINLSSLNIADTADFGIVRIITDDNKKAKEVIREAGFTCSSQDLVAASVSNKPGMLAKVLDALAKEKLSIEYIYSYDKGDDSNLILFKTADIKKAEEIVEGLNL